MAGADNVQAVQVGGPSGTLISVKDIDHLTKTELMKVGNGLLPRLTEVGRSDLKDGHLLILGGNSDIGLATARR